MNPQLTKDQQAHLLKSLPHDILRGMVQAILLKPEYTVHPAICEWMLRTANFINAAKDILPAEVYAQLEQHLDTQTAGHFDLSQLAVNGIAPQRGEAE